MAEQKQEKPKDPNYPKMLYHRKEAPVTVHSEEEHQQFAPDEWAETPAAFNEKQAPTPAKGSKKKAADAQPQTEE